MSPSTAPLSCSLTRTARMVPLTRPQTVTSCAMTLPSICAPSPIRRSEARTSPSIRPKTCAGPLHSMLPTIDIPEPMQERVAAFVVGSCFGGGCSATDCCCCTVLPTTSVPFAATSLSLLLNLPTSMFRPHLLRKGQRLSSRDPRTPRYYPTARDALSSESVRRAIKGLRCAAIAPNHGHYVAYARPPVRVPDGHAATRRGPRRAPLFSEPEINHFVMAVT